MSEYNKPAILLLINHGWTIRNFLLSDFYKEILKSYKIILCTNLDSHDIRELGFKARQVIKMLDFEPSWFHKRVLNRRATYHFLVSGADTHALKLKRANFSRSGFHKIRVSFELFMIKTIINMVGSKFIFNVLDYLDSWFSRKNPNAKEYEKLFKKINPSLVFSTFSVMKEEHLPIYVAQKMRIKTAVNVCSWDNITSKGRLPSGCDNYIVWSNYMKQEIIDSHESIDVEKIKATGTPQYDFKYKKELICSRDQYCKDYHIDGNNKIVLYATCTQMPFEHLIVEGLIKRYLNGDFGDNITFLVRTHPQDDGTKYVDLKARYPKVIFQIPGLASKGDTKILISKLNDIEILVNTTFHSDVQINVSSTMSLDAAVFDKPIINVKYDKNPENVPLSNGIYVYDYNHYKNILKFNAINIAENEDQVVKFIESSILNPSEKKEERKAMVNEVVGMLDGKASFRIAKTIDDLIKT